MRLAYRGKPFTRCAVYVAAYGPAYGDADNILGALLDAGKGILWVDDSLKRIPRKFIEWHHDTKSNSRWVVCIEPLGDDYESVFETLTSKIV